MFNRFRQLLILVGATGYAWSATVTVCGTGCSTASLQAALDSLAGCGDTIQIKSTEPQIGNYTLSYRGCAANPITVTSDRASWLPPSGARITPSHLANMAQINTPNSNPAIKDVLDSMGRPPAGWIFVGIAFATSNGIGAYTLINFNSYGATGPSQISNNITFDRCYFHMPFTNGSLQDVIRADATNLTVKNSFFGDAYWNGYVESHAVRALTNPGPITVTNTFITTSSIPIFVGGATPSYPTYLENGLTAQYNYFWRPWKYNGDPAQPFAADYVAAASPSLRTGPHAITNVTSTGIITVPDVPPFIPASLLTITGVGGCTVANGTNWRMTQLSGTTFQLLNFPGCNSAYTSGGAVSDYAITVCNKNLGEMKWGTGVTWQYNVGENSWAGSQCQSQYNGFTDTLRTEWDSNMTKPSIGTFAMSDTTHVTWTGTYRIGNISTGANASTLQDLAICLSLPVTGTECHAVASQSGASLVTSTPFSAAPMGALNGWIVYTASAQLTNLSVMHNVYKNVDQPFSVLGLSFANGVGNAGFEKTHVISQNLAYANTNYITGYKGFNLAAAEADYRVNPSGYTIDHNTLYYPNGITHGSFVYLDGTSCGFCATHIQPKFDASTITNNLFGASSTGGNGPFSGDGVNSVIDTANAYFSNTSIKNNAIPGGLNGSTSPSGGNAVAGNIYAAWSDPFGGLAPFGVFSVSPSSPYYHAATDGTSIGADFTQLPMINNLQVIPSVNSASLGFDVSAPIADVKGTQVCVLEVSSNRNLLSDLGSYTVIPDLDPVLSQHSDLSTRSDVLVSGNHVTWPINGLAVGSTYYGRLMCHGDTEWFTFQMPTGTGTQASACDLNTDGVVSVLDVQLAVNMSLGSIPCTANINGSGVCEVTTIQRVVNAALGGTCVTGP